MGRRALVLLVALLLAGVAAFAVYQYLDGIRDAEREGLEEVTVYRATEPVLEGQDGDLFLQSPTAWAESTDQTDDIPGTAIGTEEELRAVIGGRVAVGPISTNEILTADQWVELTVDITPLAEQIPSGKQALSISLDQIRGVNGFIRPGDLVNAIITLDISRANIPGEGPGFAVPSPEGEDGTPEEQVSPVVTLTRYVLQGLPVLAVGQDVRPQEGEATDVPTPGAEGVEGEAEEAPSSVFTIEVTPEQAERLVYSFENASVWFTLVPEDFVAVDTEGVTLENLFEGDLVNEIFGS